jgi:putative ABC transport system substrate-binding protein
MAYLAGGTEAAGAHPQKALLGRLEELGYREGRNLIIERRFADARPERLPVLAGELVALKPDLLFGGAANATLALSKATSTIPIVFVGVPDPVGMGIVKSLGRPGTNATGLSAQNVELQSKRMQLLKEALPSASRVAVLSNPQNAPSAPMVAAIMEASKTLGLELRVIEANSEQELGAAFKTLEMQPPDVLYVVESPLTFAHRARIVASANRARLPAVYGLQEFVEAGGLMSYYFIYIEQFRAAATFIDKILKGAKPAELPVEQPTRFELVLNLKTANALGVKFPPTILLRADRVIE